MKKLVSFKILKSVCGYEDKQAASVTECSHKDGRDFRCNSKNCPIWKKLKEATND